MFDSHEALKCQSCGDAFMGRKPAEGGTAYCYKCWSTMKAPIVTEKDDIPASVLEEHDSRGGENGGD